MENNNMENNINNGNVNPNGSNGMSIAALVCGILGIVGSFIPIPYVSYVTLPLAILGIIFGALGRKKSTNKGLATAGLALGIIGCAFSAIAVVCVVCALIAAGSLVSMA